MVKEEKKKEEKKWKMIKLKNMKYSDWARSWSRVKFCSYLKKTKKQTKEHTVTEAKTEKEKRPRQRTWNIQGRWSIWKQSYKVLCFPSNPSPILFQFGVEGSFSIMQETSRRLTQIHKRRKHSHRRTYLLFFRCKQNYTFCALSLFIGNTWALNWYKHKTFDTDQQTIIFILNREY